MTYGGTSLLWHAVPALVIATAAFALPAFAGERSSLYPEGSIFNEAPVTLPFANRPPSHTSAAAISPRDPLDAPDAANVWKPSNRDAGNLTVRRWDEYAEHLKALEGEQ